MLLRLQFEINDFDTDVNGNNGSERKTTLKARVDRGDLLVGHRYRPLIPLKSVWSVPVRIKWLDSPAGRQSAEGTSLSDRVVVEHCTRL
jgi:hypothetical protein